MDFDELRSQYFTSYSSTARGRSTLLLESAIAHARGVHGTSCPSSRPGRLSAKEFQKRFDHESRQLEDWAAENGISATYPESSELATHHTFGTEHFIWFEKLIVKRVTYENSGQMNQGPFGQTLEAFSQEGLDGNPVTLIENRKALPSEYLERLYIQNILFEIENELTSISPLGIVTSQPMYSGERVTDVQLRRFLNAYGFEYKSPLTWFHAGLEIAISDVALHNVVNISGAIMPFDIWANVCPCHDQANFLHQNRLALVGEPE